MSSETDNHTSISPLSSLQAGCPSCCLANSVKGLKVRKMDNMYKYFVILLSMGPLKAGQGLWVNVALAAGV